MKIKNIFKETRITIPTFIVAYSTVFVYGFYITMNENYVFQYVKNTLGFL